jgi:hypothetical protein
VSIPESNAAAILTCSTGTVRDRLWMWTHPAHSYDTARSKEEWPFTDYGFTKTSRMTPAEGALYLGLPNVVYVRYSGKPLPEGFEREARILQPFKRIVWAINIAPRRNGPLQFRWTSTDAKEHDVIRDLFKRYPNMTGIILDDYFKNPGEQFTANGAGEVQAFKKTFGRAELWDALYTKDIEKTDKAHMQSIDVITLWTREASDIVNLESNVDKLYRLYPRARTILGVYMWDYLGEKRPIPLGLMKHQCELGLEWLKGGRVEGICFIGSPMCDMDVEAVEWTRRWIRHVADERL